MVYVLAACAAAVAGGILLGVPGIYKRAQAVWMRHQGEERREKYAALQVRESPEKGMERDFRKCLTGTVLILTGALCLAAYLEGTQQQDRDITQIARPSFGEGEQTERLTVSQENGADLTLELTVKEQTPDAEQEKVFFDRIYQKAASEILGENSSLQEVRSDLNLLTRLENAELEWEVSDASVINRWGEVQENISPDGESAKLYLNIVYGTYQRSYVLPVTVWGEAASQKEDLESYINEQIAENRSEDSAALPEVYQGQKLRFRRSQDPVSGQLLLLALLAIPVLWVANSSHLEDAYQKRNDALLRDYPEIVSKLSILLQAGLTVPLAWKRIVADYEEKLAQGMERRFGYEEMRRTALCMTGTGYGGRIFGEFGRRCGSYCYMKLGNLLEQHMKTGVANLCRYMEEEALQAFEMRKSHARKRGEEAGTKLLLPMMMMFVLVLVMVIVPAWSGMQI